MTRLEPTPSQTVGPFLHVCMLDRFGPELVASGAAGAVRIRGAVLDGAGEPVADAVVELWQAGPDGRYTASGEWFGRSDTRAGGFSFRTAKPGPVPWPGGGLQAPHLDLGVFARGLLKRAFTRLYFPEEWERNAADPVLSALEPAARETLVALAEPDGTLRFDIHLQGPRETVFFAL